MDSSPLTLARDHAAAASVAGHAADTTVAISEHALAAGEFARAASNTSSAEALRTLKLLEQHHLQLSTLLKVDTKSIAEEESQGDTKVAVVSSEGPAQSTTKSRSAKNAEILASHPRNVKVRSSLYIPTRGSRDTSSSIVSTLANARGIRASHAPRALSPSVTPRQAPGSLEVPARKLVVTTRNVPAQAASAHEPSWIPPVTQPSRSEAEVVTSRVKAETSAASPAPSAADESFSRWSTAFNNVMSKLSAPLAFAGLPLIIDEEPIKETKIPAAKTTTSQHHHSSPARSIHEPDVTKFFSKTALDSIQYPLKAQESFYHVPSTGHTVSCAGILNFAEKEKRRHLNASMHSMGRNEDDEDDYFEALEHPTGSHARQRSKNKTTKPFEVLELENAELRKGVDHLTRRLQNFENAAQSSGLAMQESIRLQRPLSPATARRSRPVEGVRHDDVADQLGALQLEVENSQMEMERLRRENAKLTSVVSRYRERWEQLRQGAKKKREVGGKGAGAAEGSREASGNEEAKADDPAGAGRFVAG